ncbi:hypothetical protein CAPTEDRAFT_219817 [Capitella teleta]|uniref:NADH dehydrogenase [ubiquinone] 1 alpha subcomplex subunit 11 n=1 Tax=Capitella teleta TaxID=283909 RepID=R7U2K9_CAPTE|nr:hypothetical protein CAPTEDRAFT_219817 [Capitella teleta]|eukprot:ELT97881.1 hypothetical protein CAPTEDRAFT_219817 [Capitella teleta]
MSFNLLQTYNYNSPDGQDVVKKAAHSAKLGTVIGGSVAMYDILLYSKTTGVFQRANRAAMWVIPAAGLGAMLSVTANLLGQMRNKSDFKNHLIAGALTGLAYGVLRRHWTHSLNGSLALGIGAAGVKDFFDRGGRVGSDTYDTRVQGLLRHESRHWGSRKELFPPKEY